MFHRCKYLGTKYSQITKTSNNMKVVYLPKNLKLHFIAKLLFSNRNKQRNFNLFRVPKKHLKLKTK